ncbi:hypothetical protein [Marilutibacter chinensis]|uniref:Uncharacterized protein n=1 Tax=Marilutibacter chinensis TaxID=2912247 RepID=A0ABS9HQU5_9GAMM|nr:hypothetical protein [Lysobacter chinensis]MCF7221309.1 hypothetical protein [Lysobacter chinensis]
MKACSLFTAFLVVSGVAGCADDAGRAEDAAAIAKRLDEMEERLARLEGAMGTRTVAQEGRRPAGTAAPGGLLPGTQIRAPVLNRPASPAGNDIAVQEDRFNQEAVDQKWASSTQDFLDDVLASAISNAGVEAKGAEVSCRSATCRIDVEMDRLTTDEDLILYLGTDMAEVFPRSKIYRTVNDRGEKKVSIFVAK